MKFLGACIFVCGVGCGGTLLVDNDAATRPVGSDGSIDAPAVDAGRQTDAGNPWKTCKTTDECTTAGVTCCGVCGLPTIKDVTGVNKSSLSAYSKSLCSGGERCPECASMINPNLLAECEASSCEAFDLAQSKYSTCKTDADCHVDHTACCSCSTEDLVAVNVTFQGYVYASDPTCALKDCVGCEPPGRYRAVCGSTGHCGLVIGLGG